MSLILGEETLPPVRPPAMELVSNWANDLSVPLAGRPAGQRGQTDGPSGDALAPARGSSVPRCVSMCAQHQQTGPCGVQGPPVFEAAPHLFLVHQRRRRLGTSLLVYAPLLLLSATCTTVQVLPFKCRLFCMSMLLLFVPVELGFLTVCKHPSPPVAFTR